MTSKRRRQRLRGKLRANPNAGYGPAATRAELESAPRNYFKVGILKGKLGTGPNFFEKRIATIDFEASSINGWPIESGWMREGDNKPHSMLIRPAPGWSMSEWSEDSAQVHYISPRDLERYGVDVREVVDALQADLAGFTVVSDAPHLDQRWLARLCEAAGRPLPFTIEAASTVTKVGPVRHRAGPDAEQLLRAIITARPDHADAEFAAAFLAQKGSIPEDVDLGIDD